MIKKMIVPIVFISIFCSTPYLLADQSEKAKFCSRYGDNDIRVTAQKNTHTELREEKEAYQPVMVPATKASAQGSDTYITAGIGGLSGDTTYQIGGNYVSPSGSGQYHFPISELKFPLDVWMISIEGSKEFAKKWKMSAGAKKSFTNDAGKMEDSDWMTSSNPGRLDVYSESDTYLDAFIMDINFGYRFYKKLNWSFIAGVGYIYQKFDYECKLDRQWSPSGLSGWDATGTGSVDLTYEVTYRIPYIEIGTIYTFDNTFSVEASLGYSLFVDVEDLDVHILRSKFSEGDCEGDAILFSLKGRYNFPRNWFLLLQVDYMYIDTDGRQKQYTNGVWSATIDQEITSEQAFGGLSVGYVF